MAYECRPQRFWQSKHSLGPFAVTKSIGIEPFDWRPVDRKCRLIRPTVAGFWWPRYFPDFAFDCVPTRWCCRLFGQLSTLLADHCVGRRFHRGLNGSHALRSEDKEGEVRTDAALFRPTLIRAIKLLSLISGEPEKKHEKCFFYLKKMVFSIGRMPFSLFCRCALLSLTSDRLMNHDIQWNVC